LSYEIEFLRAWTVLMFRAVKMRAIVEEYGLEEYGKG
jgi:hypothetical protein